MGAGPGWWWDNGAQHLEADAVVTITDLSPGMVEESVGRLRAIGRNVTGRIADAVSLPFADESFDIVAAHYMLYHVPDPRQALHEFRRVLRPGGTLVAASNGSPRETEALRIELARRTVDGVLQVQKETGLFVAKK